MLGAQALTLPGLTQRRTPILEAALSSQPDALEDLVAGRLPEGQGLLILVDQFEELFRFRRKDGQQAAAFVQALLEPWLARTPGLYVMLTMRTDFLGDCHAFPDLPKALSAGQYLVPRMTRQELQSAIERPLEVLNIHASTDLLQRLLNDHTASLGKGSENDQLPLLQHALARLAAKSPSREWDLQLYQNGIHGRRALEMHLEEVAEFSSIKRQVCQRLFQCLTEIDPHGRRVRRPCSYAELKANLPVAEGPRLIERMRQLDCNFLSPGPEVPLFDSTIVDITHEAIMRQWPALQGWMDEELEDARRLARLRDAQARLKPGDYRGAELLDIHQWWGKRKPSAAWIQRFFQGDDYSSRLVQAEACRVTLESFLGESQKLERQRTDEERQYDIGAKVKNRLLIAAIAAAGVMLFLAVDARGKSAEAETQTALAVKERGFAEEQKRLAEYAKIDADHQRERADAAANTAKLQQAQALISYGQIGTQIYLSSAQAVSKRKVAEKSLGTVEALLVTPPCVVLSGFEETKQFRPPSENFEFCQMSRPPATFERRNFHFANRDYYVHWSAESGQTSLVRSGGNVYQPLLAVTKDYVPQAVCLAGGGKWLVILDTSAVLHVWPVHESVGSGKHAVALGDEFKASLNPEWSLPHYISGGETSTIALGSRGDFVYLAMQRDSNNSSPCRAYRFKVNPGWKRAEGGGEGLRSVEFLQGRSQLMSCGESGKIARWSLPSDDRKDLKLEASKSLGLNCWSLTQGRQKDRSLYLATQQGIYRGDSGDLNFQQIQPNFPQGSASALKVDFRWLEFNVAGTEYATCQTRPNRVRRWKGLEERDLSSAGDATGPWVARYSPNGLYLAAGFQVNGVRLWPLETTDRPLAAIIPAPVLSLDLTDKLLAAGTQSGNVQFYSIGPKNLSRLSSSFRGAGPVWSISFCDQSLVAVACGSKIWLIDSDTGFPCLPPYTNATGNYFHCVTPRWSSNGTLEIAASSAGGGVHYRALKFPKRDRAKIFTQAEIDTGCSLDDSGNIQFLSPTEWSQRLKALGPDGVVN